MIRRPPRSTLTDTLVPDTPLFRSLGVLLLALLDHRQGVLVRGERLQIAGAVIDRYTLGGSWTRRSQDNRTDRCESAFTHSSSFPARWRPTLPVKDRQPVFGIVADLGADGIEQHHRFRGARENCQLVGETAKIELDDD